MKRKIISTFVAVMLVWMSISPAMVLNAAEVDSESEVTREKMGEGSALEEEADAPVEEEDSVGGEEDEVNVFADPVGDFIVGGDSAENAVEISLERSYSGALSEGHQKDYYKFSLSSSGKITIKANAKLNAISYQIYDSDGEKIWDDSFYSDSTTNMNSIEKKVDLTKGIYYFYVESYYTGNYSFNLSFESAGESFEETGNGTNNEMSMANVIALGNKYQGQIAKNDNNDFYKFILPSSGRIILTAEAEMTIDYYIYNLDGEQVWKHTADITDIGGSVTKEVIDLTKGSYYFVAAKEYWGSTGNYSFALPFESAGESFEETGSGSNNETSTASEIVLAKQYKGQIAENDKKDIYKLVLSSSGRVNIAANAGMTVVYRIYDTVGELLWDYEARLSVAGVSTVNRELDLTKGTYFFVVEREEWNTTGNYSFTLSLQSAGESHEESDIQNNNSIAVASKISLDQNYKGQIAVNDRKDYFAFVLPKADLLNLNVRAEIKEVYYTIYNADGKEVWSKTVSSDSISQVSNFSDEVGLPAGTYYFAVERKSDYTGPYSFQLHCHTYQQIITKATTRADGKIEQKCKCGHVGDTSVISYPRICELSKTSYTFDGKAKKPSVTIRDALGRLVGSSNYTVRYSNGCKDPGKYSVTVQFKGQYYTGTLTKQFEITSRPINSASVTLSKSNYFYDGKAKKPSVTVKLNKVTLKKDKDYRVTYKKNKAIGTATVIVTGIGNYRGSIKKSFKITAKKGTIVTVGSYKYKISGTSEVAFAGLANTKVTKVVIPATVKISGKSYKVTSIDAKALQKKTKIASVTIGSNVKTIGSNAFYGCKKLSTVTIRSTKLKAVGRNAFKSVKATAKIKVPGIKWSIYKKLLKNKGQGKRVKIVK